MTPVLPAPGALAAERDAEREARADATGGRPPLWQAFANPDATYRATWTPQRVKRGPRG